MRYRFMTTQQFMLWAILGYVAAAIAGGVYVRWSWKRLASDDFATRARAELGLQFGGFVALIAILGAVTMIALSATRN